MRFFACKVEWQSNAVLCSEHSRVSLHAGEEQEVLPWTGLAFKCLGRKEAADII